MSIEKKKERSPFSLGSLLGPLMDCAPCEMDSHLRGNDGIEGVRGWGFAERDKGSGLVPLPFGVFGVNMVVARG